MQSPREYLRCHPEALRLYAVTDASWLGGRTLDECVLEAVEGGATFVQLRDKHASTCDLVEQCGRLRRVIPGDVPFVINDDLEAARMAQADGVHVGQSDAACEEARRVLGPDGRSGPCGVGCRRRLPRRGGAVQNGYEARGR